MRILFPLASLVSLLLGADVVAVARSTVDNCSSAIAVGGVKKMATDSKVGKSITAANCSSAIAVVDIKKVATDSKVGKDIDKQMAAINDESKKYLLDLESKIKSMETNKKSDSDARKIEDMQLILYDLVRQKKYDIAKAYRVAIASFDAEIKKIIEKICVEKNIKIVIAHDAVVYASDACLDITDDVIRNVNKSCPPIKVEVKEGEESATA
ncbi:MAG: OmpH family outer membrane protein [Holosporaceae bacterium]|jgi:Skp family chaperone for outer membrane proteins|nr:OmpH family outer membrane protein [Holosporaceae bacterium]